jgi:hypothetical protein
MILAGMLLPFPAPVIKTTVSDMTKTRSLGHCDHENRDRLGCFIVTFNTFIRYWDWAQNS